MIRPSALQLARDCRYSAELGERFPESSEYAEDGTDLHADVRALVAQAPITGASPRAKVVADFMSDDTRNSQERYAEVKIGISDPDTDEKIAEGTADYATIEGDITTVYDYKFGRLENVPHPNENWQLKTYGAALAIKHDLRGFVPVIVGERDGHVVVIRGDLVTNVSEIIDEIRAVNSRQSSPILGPHCSRCYSTKYCHAYQAQTQTALAIIELVDSLVLTDESVSLLSQRIDQVEDALKAAKAIRRDYIARGGRVVVDGKEARISLQQGRESANVAALKADGLESYVKRGEPFEKITWAKAKIYT